jgi:plastocyanin
MNSNNRNKNNKSNIHLFLAIVGALTLLIPITDISAGNAFAQQGLSNGNAGAIDAQPNINAETIFNTKTMTLGSNVKNLVILIPNEGHHAAGEDNEARFLDQHFVPENAIVNTGTAVSWFNGDAGHERTIDVKDTDKSSSVFNTGEIVDSQASDSFTFGKPGVYNYDAEGDPGVTMTGSVTVRNIKSPVMPSTNQSSSGIDTVGILMVPTQDIDNYIEEITRVGISVDNTFDFKDLRGGQEGTGDTQTLIVWTTGGKELSETISSLSEISMGLPYS